MADPGLAVTRSASPTCDMIGNIAWSESQLFIVRLRPDGTVSEFNPVTQL